MGITLRVPRREVPSYGRLARMTATAPQQQPRGGVLRTRTTVRLHPEHEQHYRELAQKLGLTLSDTLAYLCAKAADLELPADLQAEPEAGKTRPQRKLMNQRPPQSRRPRITAPASQERLIA